MISAENFPNPNPELSPELANMVLPIDGVLATADGHWEKTFSAIKEFNGVDAAAVWRQGNAPAKRRVTGRGYLTGRVARAGAEPFSEIEFVGDLRRAISLACIRAEQRDRFTALDTIEDTLIGAGVLACEISDSYNNAAMPNAPNKKREAISKMTLPLAQALLLQQVAFDKTCSLLDDPTSAKPLVSFLEAISDKKTDNQTHLRLLRLVGTHVHFAQDYTNVVLAAVRRDAPGPLELADEYLAANFQPNAVVPHSEEVRIAFRILRLHSKLFEREVECASPDEAEALHRAWLIEQHDEWPSGLKKSLESYAKQESAQRWQRLKGNLDKYSDPAKKLYRNTKPVSDNS